LPHRLTYRGGIGAAMLVFAAVLGLIAYSYDALALAVGMSAYAAIIFWRPNAWLLLLPPIMGWLNLSPWSGRFFLEEFDLFIIVTVVMLIIRGAYTLDRSSVPKLGWIGFGVYFTSWVISLAEGLFPLPIIDANAFSSYYSHYNALRIAKAFLWAIMLWPAISHAYRYSRAVAMRFFGWGMAVAVFGVGIIALWERGVFTQIVYSHNIYAILNAVLNFSTHYRITGLFAEMHTGGEAIDGFLAVTLPFTLYAAFHGGNKYSWLVGTCTAILGFYAAATTFSRTTYFASIVVVATLGVIFFSINYRSIKKLPILPFLGVALVLVLLSFGYKKGGGLLLVSGELGCVGAIVGGYLYRRVPYQIAVQRLILLACVVCGLLAAYGSVRGMMTSKWAHTGLGEAITLAIATGVAASLGGAWLGTKLSGKISIRALLVIAVLLMGAGTTLIPALFGFRMEERFSASTKDFTTRWDHWLKSIAVMDRSASSYLYGEGLGRFPDIFYWKKAVNEVGMYRFAKEDNNQFLTLRGGPDLRYGQRVALDANKKYTLAFDARTHDIALDLRVRICRRNIIQPYDWNPECVKFDPDVRNKVGEWHHYTWDFNMGNLGNGVRLGRKPLMLELSNLRVYKYKLIPPTLVDLDNITIKDSDGNEYLRNGDFERGSLAWYPYFDFSHLPWHTKNFWVGLFFGQGFLGVLGMLVLMLAALQNGIRRLRDHEVFAPYLISSLAGFLAVGLFGTLVDVPRIMTLFYIILFSLLMLPRSMNSSDAAV